MTDVDNCTGERDAKTRVVLFVKVGNAILRTELVHSDAFRDFSETNVKSPAEHVAVTDEPGIVLAPV